jgi:hypothetical protein
VSSEDERPRLWGEVGTREFEEAIRKRREAEAYPLASIRRLTRPNTGPLDGSDVPPLWWDIVEDRLFTRTGDRVFVTTSSIWEPTGYLPSSAVPLAPMVGIGRQRPLAADPRGRKTPEARFELDIRATAKDGTPFPKRVGTFRDAESAWGWWFRYGLPNCDPNELSEVGANEVYLPWDPS